MTRMLRKLRAALGLGSLWALAGTTAGALVGLITSAFGGMLLPQLFELAVGAGVIGFALGIGFAAALVALEPCRTLDDLSTGRAAIWGALAGAALSLGVLVVTAVPVFGTGILHPRLLVAALATSGAYGAVSSILAALTVELARGAPPRLEVGPGSLPPHRLPAPYIPPKSPPKKSPSFHVGRAVVCATR